jgi:ABC-2 type transport system permease protein
MRNILVVIKHEIITTISKPSFWVMAILFPIFIVGINIFTQVMAQNAVEDTQVSTSERLSAGTFYAYVDEAGLIQNLPADVPARLMVEYPTEEAARQAVYAGEIDAYTIIAQDYLETGQIDVIQKNFSLLGSTPEDVFEYVIAYNLTGDANLTAAITNPLPQVQSHQLAQPTEDNTRRASSNMMGYLVPFAVMFIFFFLITMGGGYMLQSVSREKENRTVEVLLVSINPLQLMFGKIVGLSAVALLQMLIWLGGGLLALNQVNQLVEAAEGFKLPAGFVILAVLFFLLGYLMYAALLGAVGALAPSAKEGGQLTFIVMLPLIIPLWFNQALLQNPQGTIAMIFSMIPFTAPVSMLTRLAVVNVPFWQVLLSLAGLAVTTYLMVLLAARFFRADTLLSSAPIKKERVLSIFRS